MELQKEYGPVYDITCDCEDGAAAGNELEHARLVAVLINSEENTFRKAGARIHDPTHPCWKQDVDEIVGAAAGKLAYVTIPKATQAAQVREVIDYVQSVARREGVTRAIPVHVLIETHGALRTRSRSPRCRTWRCSTSA